MASSEEEWEVTDGPFGDDGATPADAIAQQTTQDCAQEKGDSDAVESGAERAASAEQSPAKRTTKTATRKRGRSVVQHNHDDSDLESQPTITKWFRQVPGPLHDVMKKQQLDLQQSMDDDGVFASGRSSGHIVHISTVFDTGAWVDMCDFLGMATSPGELYGGIKMSSLKHTIAHIQEDDQNDRSPRLLVLIKSMRYVDEEIVAVFHDPSGEMDGYFHREIVEQVGPALVSGTAVLLREVAIFSPSDAAVGGTNKRYLNIIPRNVEAVFPASAVATIMEPILRAYNERQVELIRADIEAEQKAKDDESLATRQRGLAPVDVRTATTELSFISQRQVVQRHQPVRPDPSESASETSGNKKKKKVKDAPSGLGRWQWHTLAQKKPVTTTDDGDDEAAPEPRRPFPSGRFTQLLSQHIQARRAAAGSDRLASTTTAASSQRESTATQGAPAKAVRFTTIQETTIDDEDDDGDW